MKLTEQMDTHDVGRGRGGIAKALLSLEMPSLVIGIDSDVLYVAPPKPNPPAPPP